MQVVFSLIGPAKAIHAASDDTLPTTQTAGATERRSDSLTVRDKLGLEESHVVSLNGDGTAACAAPVQPKMNEDMPL